jgi:hypothetical protein
VTIELPQGFELESADAPAAAKVGDMALLDIKMAVTQDGHTLHYVRKFSFGGTQVPLFPAAQYGPVKQLFDAFYAQNTHMLTVRESASAPAR